MMCACCVCYVNQQKRSKSLSKQHNIKRQVLSQNKRIYLQMMSPSSFHRLSGNSIFLFLLFFRSQPPVDAFCTHGSYRRLPTSLQVSASELLYQDQQEGMLRRAIREEELLCELKNPQELKAKTLKAGPPKAGTGFANTSPMDKSKRLASEQAKVIKRDGVIRINNALSPQVAEKLRQHILSQQQICKKETDLNPRSSKLFYGVEQGRKNRCDLHLSLSRGGIQTTDGDSKADEGHVLADALQEILGQGGSLRDVYESLVSLEGEFYELAGIITNPGSNRQMIHPDLPFNKLAPLYVVFLALQDVTEEMGPTSFLLKSHTAKSSKVFESGNMDAKDEQLKNANCRLATLQSGDAVIFDARVLHCGGANSLEKRVMLNFSFRNPKVTGDIGYKGSIFPGYEKQMRLVDIGKALESYSKGEADPFAQYGNAV